VPNPRFAAVVVLLLAQGCATPRPLSEAAARGLASEAFGGEADAVLDAVWLTLEARGYRATAHDAARGTLAVTRADGHGYDVTVETREGEQVVTAMPRSPRPLMLGGDDGEDARWAALWKGTRALLDAWREPPEWRYETRTNTLVADGVSFRPPKAWAYLDFDIHRHRARLLRHRGRRDAPLNPALLAVVERRRPLSTVPLLLGEAAGMALTARSRLTLPDELETALEPGGAVGGTMRVLDGTTPREVRWHARTATRDAWTVTLVAVCGTGEDACDEEWWQVAASVKGAGGAQ
jgi:hypothetical protein